MMQMPQNFLVFVRALHEGKKLPFNLFNVAAIEELYSLIFMCHDDAQLLMCESFDAAMRGDFDSPAPAKFELYLSMRDRWLFFEQFGYSDFVDYLSREAEELAKESAKLDAEYKAAMALYEKN